MDNSGAFAPDVDVERLVGLIVDPTTDLETRLKTISELRDLYDIIKVSDSAPNMAALLARLLEVLRTEPAAFRKESLEYRFRKALLDLVIRGGFTDPQRFPVEAIFTILLHLIRHDNEDNAVACLKALGEASRQLKAIPAESLKEYSALLQECCHNLSALIPQLFSEGSPALDPEEVRPAAQSFQTVHEMVNIIVTYMQVCRALAIPHPDFLKLLPDYVQFIGAESPLQKKAREDYESMGNVWSGMAADMPNAQEYEHMLSSRGRVLSWCAYVMRMAPDLFKEWGDTLAVILMRLMQDLPLGDSATRKDLLAVFRIFLQQDSRKSFVPHLDKLLDENVMTGTSMLFRDVLQSTMRILTAEFGGHLLGELSWQQVLRVAEACTRSMNNATLNMSCHTQSLRFLTGAAETLVTKVPAPDGVKAVRGIIEATLDRLQAAAVMHAHAATRLETAEKQSQDDANIALIEKERPMAAFNYVTEKPEAVMTHCRDFLMQAVQTLAVCLKTLQKASGPVSDGTLMGNVFRTCSMTLHFLPWTQPGVNKAADEILSKVAGALLLILSDMHPHTFQEVWSLNTGFFLEQARRGQYPLHLLSQLCLGREDTSVLLVPILLKALVERLDQVGNGDEEMSVILLRAFRHVFNAVVKFPTKTQGALAVYMAKIITDSFSLASKAVQPTYYYQLVRTLFRAMGQTIVNLQTLFEELVGILPDMLDSLHRQLNAADASTRDQVVELFLNIPVRLTNLLPHLWYLMRPLALALRGGPELVSLGLRTLELCVDHLTADFLDPILERVLREIHEALHALLKPGPHGVPMHAPGMAQTQQALRLLGKLGGRNRKLLNMDPVFRYRDHTDVETIPVPFEGRMQPIPLGPGSTLALQTFKRPTTPGTMPYKVHAFHYARTCLSVLVHQGIESQDARNIFLQCLESLYDAIQLPEIQAEAETCLHQVSQHVFSLEMRMRQTSADSSPRRWPSPALLCFLDALPYALTRERAEESEHAHKVVQTILENLAAMAPAGNDAGARDVTFIVLYISGRFNAMCLEDTWARKAAGCQGLKLMLGLPALGIDWLREKLFELVRTLLHVLKSLPSDHPRNVDEVIGLVVRLLHLNHNELADPLPDQAQAKLNSFVWLFFQELNNQSALVRKAVQSCIIILSELSGKTPYELLLPLRDRHLAALYTKPLRALGYSTQIGVIEAVRYCLCLTPPLPEMGDELVRLLGETLALASADDTAPFGRTHSRQGAQEIVKLKVACIRLLNASIAFPKFFGTTGTQERVVHVLFRAIYSSHLEVKEVAREGLVVVLGIQGRLPRDLLHNGLKPVLNNLSDANKLSLTGLEGLESLLGILTTSFKVELGVKLLEHFRHLADPQVLKAVVGADVEEIKKLVCLANLFHLLPPDAGVYLEDLVNAVMQAEAYMNCFESSPFTIPLGRYLNQYARTGSQFFLRNLKLQGYFRALRNIVRSGIAPQFALQLASSTATIIASLHTKTDQAAALQLCVDLAGLFPFWLSENPTLVDAVVTVWRAERSRQTSLITDDRHKCFLMLSIFRHALEQSPRIDVLFELVSIYSRDLVDVVEYTRFVYKHVAMDDSLAFRRNILGRFSKWVQSDAVPAQDKQSFIRFIVTPMLLVQAAREPKQGLVDEDLIRCLMHCFWKPAEDEDAVSGTEPALSLEVLHLTSVIVANFPEQLHPWRQELAQFIVAHLTNADPVIKLTAHWLGAQFCAAFPPEPGHPKQAKFLMTIYVGLLKPQEVETKRTLLDRAHEAIAVAIPALPSEDSDVPAWARTTRRMLSEEATTAAQISAIYHFIVRQPDVFYPVRSLFLTAMVNASNRLGSFGGQLPEARLLSIEIVETIFKWDRKARDEARDTEGMDMDDDGDEERSEPLTLSLTLRENVVSYLVRLACISAQEVTPNPRSSSSTFAPRALTMIRQLVGPEGWKDVTVKLNYFSRALEQTDLTEATAQGNAVSSARVLQAVCADKEDEWFRENGPVLQALIRKGILADHQPLHSSLQPIFDRLIQLFPLPAEDEEPSPMADFHDFIRAVLVEGPMNAAHVRAVTSILGSVVQVRPESIHDFSALLLKVMRKVAGDQQCGEPGEPEQAVSYLLPILDIVRTSISFMPPESRKGVLQGFIWLLERTQRLSVCSHLLDIARDWALHRQDSYPNQKDKAGLLLKMTRWERFIGERKAWAHESLTSDKPRDFASLFTQFLEAVYSIYTHPTLRRSDLTSRLENPFLLGCRSRDTHLRERFIALLDTHVPRSLFGRLSYVMGSQSWEPLADHNWIYLALHLILGAVDSASPLLQQTDNAMDVDAASAVAELQVDDLLRPLRGILILDPPIAHDLWVSLFPTLWARLSRREQVDLTHHMITLLSKEYHLRQSDMRPNVIQTFLAGLQGCVPPVILPPHLVKYLAKTFGAWHSAAEILADTLEHVMDEVVTRDIVYDSLAELYAELAEEDAFCGLWRRRAVQAETSVGIAFQQNGLWEQAAGTYEQALGKTKNASLPFVEPEYCLWEDHWVLSQEKLQQWDILYDLGRNENNYELVMESTWRIRNWSEGRELVEEHFSHLPEAATPRRCVFAAFLALLRNPPQAENSDFHKSLQDGMKLTLHKWVGLPARMSQAHVPLLQHFQQFTELQEAVQIFSSLSTTNGQNLEKKAHELKLVLQAWRERLPNASDDISVWSDLVAWRKNVFNAINQVYLPLVQSSIQGNGNASSNASTLGYRGFHETAWIINRFAQTARKHELLEVCMAQLTTIYTLPNIEISEAFLKLREQARCHYQRRGADELQYGLDVVNNTNLMYFSMPQKAEFFTLKGMFHAKAQRSEDANQAFAQAVHTDMYLAKAWAQWGKFHDAQFKREKTELQHGANAVSCYLQAAGLYKSGKSRPLLSRVLWLLSVEDPTSTISRQFDQYKGEGAFWYWITFIPQLCLAVSHREVKQARYILLNLAKIFPQALYYPLRTQREDLMQMRKQQQHVATLRMQAQNPSSSSNPAVGDSQPAINSSPVSTSSALRSRTAEGEVAAPPQLPISSEGQAMARQAWEYVEEIVQILKTAFPLLVLSLETIVDQLSKRFRSTTEEEVYRNVGLLLLDAVQTYNIRMNDPDDDLALRFVTTERLGRLSQTFAQPLKDEFDADFVKPQLNQLEYARRLQKWRTKLEQDLDSRPTTQSLDVLSHYLTEFHYGKFDDIEVPGQYTETRDTNTNFVRIQKFYPKFDNCRTNGWCYRRLTMQGNDHSKTSFAVLTPAHRSWRREDRVMQAFRTFNVMLSLKKETRKRNLGFHIPIAVQLTPSLRLVHNDASTVILSDIHDQYCDELGFSREESMLRVGELTRACQREFRQAHGRAAESHEFREEKQTLFQDIASTMIPDTILSRYMSKTMEGPSELWTMRKQFATQLAAVNVMTYVFCLSGRNPGRFAISRETGKISMTDLVPPLSQQQCAYYCGELVPFRFTPNLQKFVGPIHTEGILTTGMMAIGRALTEPEEDLENQLSLFSKDEVETWLRSVAKQSHVEVNLDFRNRLQEHSRVIVERFQHVGCHLEREQSVATAFNPPVSVSPVGSVTSLISKATNVENLAMMTEVFNPWF